MHCFLLICLCASVVFLQTQALDSASELILRPCKATDPLLKECWLHKIEDLRLDLIRGIPELRLPSVDTLLIQRLTVGKRKSLIASYEAVYRNIVFTGAKHFHILNASIDSDALVFKLKVILPSVHLSTSFNVNGTILGFRLLGDGSGEGSFSNLIVDLVLDGERYTKNGQEHILWKEGSVEITYEQPHFKIYDVIKDPTELLVFNYFFNQNIEGLRGTITSFLDRTLGNFAIEAINRVHEAFPGNSLYPIY